MSLFSRKKKEPATKNEEQAKTAGTVKAVQPKQKSGKAVKKSGSQVSYKVLVHPLVTEKSTLQNSFNQYAFIVNSRANKVEIKLAIQETYGVMPLKVKTISQMGKLVRSGRGRLSRQKNWKKAIITLPQDKKIDVYEAV
ncbi:50S ribosomal protein L23 [Candidatus Kuenenbacteria bacterium CG_4_9_14_3_um_filter_39_14]|uniref:Large ribosomal subunit protein uL23 n=6 Tax=Candidatus Kueneniibacteriota TaxID=1752740 RepID=A0A2M7IMG9_9BACT|nr:50S ribosomal protein L23 [Candidatus Kuenenbacteria bacterium]PIP28932.1 MAG: 50S ribosomal protein L23 [Candidatus Kuenenbacteria bacterium CG23_combo_of_CG06-09_8_20_14_all_39_39]PIP75294.1 MAG: 50S ribosomal protein L23 [Candidatus Kuenenbacteria bacterium CG22_combo_CG10-13_8_21_14_all_39_9]PIR81080.1 MAG: 50S ribosomal protein L23 [Candidatus Kuenenbacteria bacterium CG10_big_fil_rev_8_21_14_0_10_39_14]PIW95981.1 MAG: 50S ribosomal protein L23 [Candidatus Kuenenbacteria bacterium CG_4_